MAPDVVVSSSSLPRDALGEDDGAAIRQRILDILAGQGLHAGAKAPIVGARLIRVEVSAPRGRVTAIDRAAEDVVHHLASEDRREASYSKESGLRFFTVPRIAPRQVRLGALLDRASGHLAARPGRFVLGEAIDGSPVLGDLAEPASCHLLIGGTTGSGKSILLRAIASGLAHHHSPAALRFTLVDPKRVSFSSLLAGLSAHLAVPLASDPEEALRVFQDVAEDMEDRYRLFADAKVQDIDEYNETIGDSERLARHVVIVDEFQDLLTGKATKADFVALVQKLGAKARAAGIHLILATQRPTKDNLPTSVKANLPGRLALRTQSAMESRIILESSGAEKLLGSGDLLANLGRNIVRVQAPYC